MGHRTKIQKIMDKADAKADQLGEDEINARLGPATRLFFAVGESVEDKIETYIPNFGPKFLLTLLGLTVGWLIAEGLLLIGADPRAAFILAIAFAFVGAKTSLGSLKTGQHGLLFVFWAAMAINGARTLSQSGTFGTDLGQFITLVFLAFGAVWVIAKINTYYLVTDLGKTVIWSAFAVLGMMLFEASSSAMALAGGLVGFVMATFVAALFKTRPTLSK